MKRCLEDKCPNHCCTQRFKGLSENLKCKDDSDFVQIKLNDKEVARIKSIGRKDLIEAKNGELYLKLNDDYSCVAYKDGKCSIYSVRPDVCKLYPYYFDPFCGICIDKNCPGHFDLDIPEDHIFELINNRINLFEPPAHFFFDGYDINNKLLDDEDLINKLAEEVKNLIPTSKVITVLIPYFDGKVKKDGGISLVLLADNFHFTCHTFSYKNTVFIDCYSKDNLEEKLLPIIAEYFKAGRYDLCSANDNKKGNFGRHIIINSHANKSYRECRKLVKNILKEIEMTPISDVITNYKDNDNFDILQPIAESHISVHKARGRIIIDVFSCKMFDENKIIKILSGDIQSIKMVNRGIYYK